MPILTWSIASLLLGGAFFSIFLFKPELYIVLAKEGANAELATALFYFFAGFLFIRQGYKLYKMAGTKKSIIFYLLFGLFFVFIAGEEESWGQWMFSFNTPAELKVINAQQEVNIHNLNIFAKQFDFLDPHRILNLFVIIFGIVLPWLVHASAQFRGWLAQHYFPICPVRFSSIFIMALFYERATEHLSSHWANSEIMELFFSIGFLMFALSLKPNISVGES